MEAYVSKWIELLGAKYNISSVKAAEMLENCVQQVALKRNLSIKEVNNQFYTPQFLKYCILKDCSNADLSECEELCNCVVYVENDESICIPRYFVNAYDINTDPDKFAKSLKLSELESFVDRADYLYHNYDSGGLTDNSYDALLHNLKKRYRQQKKRYLKIGAEPVAKIRITLPLPMASLNKVYPGSRELSKFMETNAQHLIWSVKLDGISGMIVYENHHIAGIYTRGNGNIGGDVTYLAEHIDLPRKVSHSRLVVRGEFVVSRSNFHSKYSDMYANPRNFVNGQIASGYVTPFLGDIDFIAYEVVQIENRDILPKPLQKYALLEMCGFKVVTHGEFQKAYTFDILMKYKTLRESSEYDIDGLVLNKNTANTVVDTLRNPTYAVAFKALLEEQIRSTKIINVDWNISRYGKYVPVAVYEAVYISGTRLTRATAHNAAHIRDWNMGKGTRIKVARSGDVIPQIKDVEIDLDTIPIYPGDKYDWHWKNRNIYLDDIENNREVQISRITHFFKTIDSRGIGPKTIEKFWDHGYNTIKKVTNMKVSDISAIRGFGAKKATQIHENITNALITTPIDRYLIAITTIELKIGRTLIKQLLRVFPNLLEDPLSNSEILKTLQALKKQKKLHGFGVKRMEMVANQIPELRKILFGLNRSSITAAIENQRLQREKLKTDGYDLRVYQKSFVLSGWMGNTPYDLEDYIYNNLGNVTTTVTSNVSAVIVPGLGNVTDKMIKAYEFGIPVLTRKEIYF